MEYIDKEKCSNASFCPICGGKSSVIDAAKTINPNSPDVLDLRNCSVCKHWWIDPMPKQEYLSRLYSDNSLFVVHKGYDEEAKTSKVDAEQMQRYAGKMSPHLKGSTSLR